MEYFWDAELKSFSNAQENYRTNNNDINRKLQQIVIISQFKHKNNNKIKKERRHLD